MIDLKRILFGILLLCSLQAGAVGFINTNEYITTPEIEVRQEQWILTDIAEVGGLYRNDLFIMSGQPMQLSGTFEGNLWGVGRLYKNDFYRHVPAQCTSDRQCVGSTGHHRRQPFCHLRHALCGNQCGDQRRRCFHGCRCGH